MTTPDNIEKAEIPATTRIPASQSAVIDGNFGLTGPLRKAIKTKGHFPNEDAARKLIYLAVRNATPQWTRCRNWTTALLAFKIHFGDRLPDTAN